MDLLERYIQLLHDSPHGLLGPADRERAADHVADAVAAATHLERLPHESLIDVGSGAGLPGIPLAITLAPSNGWLVESRQDKAAFLRDVVTQLGLPITVAASRAEELVGTIGREALDLAVARALAAPVVALEYLAPFVRIGGTVCLWATRSAAQADESAIAIVAAELGCSPPTVVALPTALRDDGALLLCTREQPVPARFPRRTGVARKRPLG